MASQLSMIPQMEQIHGEIRDTFRILANGFQKLDKTRDSNRQSKQLEELTGKVRECKSNDKPRAITCCDKTMDETDQVIERSKKVVEQTIEVGTQTAVTLKGQTEQMGRIVNDLDTAQFSIKKASQLVKEIGRQNCSVVMNGLIFLVHPNNKDIRDIPGLAPPAPRGGCYI